MAKAWHLLRSGKDLVLPLLDSRSGILVSHALGIATSRIKKTADLEDMRYRTALAGHDRVFHLPANKKKRKANAWVCTYLLPREIETRFWNQFSKASILRWNEEAR